MQELDTAYHYDSMNRLTEERRSADGDKYSYDPAGNRLKKQHYNYALTEAGQDIPCNNCTVNGDNSAGYSSIIDGEETYCCNERNELTEKKTLSVVTEYLYDENGSLVIEKEESKSASYQYDLLNRQTYVKTLNGREQENFYDGEGLRAGLSESGKASTFIFYNGEILAECSDKNKPVRRHLQGIGLSSVQTLNDNACHAYYQDEQGSTAYITGNAGTVENCYVYDAFGNVLESRETIDNRILYTGQQYDQETGQYYLRARFYNPVVGRFMQEDAYRGDGLNLYAYCRNNPVMYYDPSGYSMKDYETKPTDMPEKPKSAGEIDSKPDFIVTPDGTVLDTGKDYNLVSTTTPTNEGGEYLQIHNSHEHEGVTNPHTHRPEVNTNPQTGITSSERKTTNTTAADIDYADCAMQSGTLRERKNRKDKGGN